MPFSSDDSAAGRHADVEALSIWSRSVLASAERLTALNLNTARAMLDDSIVSIRAMLEAEDAESLLGLQWSLVEPAIERSAAYSRQLQQISSESGAEISSLTGTRLAAVNRSLSGALQKFLGSVPCATSSALFETLQKAIEDANLALEPLHGTGQMAGQSLQSPFRPASPAGFALHDNEASAG